MKIRLRTGVSAAVVLALVAGAGGVAVAVAANPSEWYSGDKNVTTADPDNVTTVTIVKADGTAVTSGTLGDPLGAFAVAAGVVRAGDTSASLFAHLPSSTTAPGAWSGQQISATTKFSGSGAATGPAGVGGKPFVSLANSLPLAATVEQYPNNSTAPSFTGVYELRLRTSSATAGVANSYGAAYIKVTGSTWAIADAPDLGQGSLGPIATVKPAWGTNFVYGTPRSIVVTVTGGGSTAKGNVKLVYGSTTLAAARTLDATGKATLTIAKGALRPGARKVRVVFTSTDTAVVRSANADKTYTVAKAKPSVPAWSVSKKVTAKKAGVLLVAVGRPAGLAVPTGKVTVVLKLGSKKVTVNSKALAGGKVYVPIGKQKAGKWKVTVQYRGDATYVARASVAKTLTVAKK